MEEFENTGVAVGAGIAPARAPRGLGIRNWTSGAYAEPWVMWYTIKREALIVRRGAADVNGHYYYS